MIDVSGDKGVLGSADDLFNMLSQDMLEEMSPVVLSIASD